jgi:hypothetical protein
MLQPECGGAGGVARRTGVWINKNSEADPRGNVLIVPTSVDFWTGRLFPNADQHGEKRTPAQASVPNHVSRNEPAFLAAFSTMLRNATRSVLMKIGHELNRPATKSLF